MKRIRRNGLVIAVAAIAVAAIVYGFWPTPVEVDTAIVERGSFEITVNDDGETRIREKYIVTSPVAGKLQRVELQEGDIIRQGETPLVRIEPRDPDPLDARSQAESEARVRAAEANKQVAEARRVQAEEAAKLARDIYDRSLELIQKDTIAQEEFDRSEHGWRMAEADLRSADFSVQVANFELQLAKAALVHTNPDAVEDLNPVMVIRAPIDGRVLRVFTEDAGVVAPGVQIMELGDPRDLELEIDVLSSAAVRIKPGANVHIEHWGGDGALEGIVRMVEPAAFLKISALGVEEKRVNIIADFREPFEDRQTLGDGYRIEARIVVDTAEEVVKVPAGALFRHNGAWHVYKVETGRAALQHVDVGKSNGEETEIRKGLTPSDVVILHPTDKVAHGVRIATAKESSR